MSAPWILQDASSNEKAVAAATAYLTGQVSAQLTTPAEPTYASNPKPTMSALDAALANLEASAIH
jgi:hypothetical protein